VWFIRYRDDYVRTPTGWRFARRVLDLQWVEEHTVVRMAPATRPGAQPGGTG
jgi:hypothetical protein